MADTKIIFCEGTIPEVEPTQANAGSTALWAGGNDTDISEYTNRIQRFEIPSGGASTDWSTLFKNTERLGSCSNGSGGFHCGGIGWDGLGNDPIDDIVLTEFYNDTIRQAYGNLHTPNYDFACFSDGLVAVTAGGGDGWYLVPISDVSTFVMNTETTNSKVGDMVLNTEGPEGASNTEYAIISGGYSYEIDSEVIGDRYLDTSETYTYATEGNTSFFGNLLYQMMVHSTSGDMTSCLVIGGRGWDGDWIDLTLVQKTIFASTGTWTDFGDMLQEDAWYRASTSDNIYSVTTGGWNTGERVEMITFASGGTATNWGDVMNQNDSLSATSGTIDVAQSICDDNTIFNISSYITLDKIELDTSVAYVSLFLVEEPTTINMNEMTVNSNIDASISNLGNAIITNSTFLMKYPLSFTDITTITVNNLTIDANINLLDESNYVCSIHRSDVPEFIADITLETDPLDDTVSPVFLNIDESFVEVIDVNATETETIIEQPPVPELVLWDKVFSGPNAIGTFAISTGGLLFGAGAPITGFGYGPLDEFTQLGTDTDWDQIAVGGQHNVALKTNGDMFVIGENNSGQLGTGDYTDEWVNWIQMPGKWKKVAAGQNFSMAIDMSDQLYGTGLNTSGQLGLGSGTDNVNEWQAIPTGGLPVLDVSCGATHAMILIQGEGKIISATGDGTQGQCGITPKGMFYTFTNISTSADWRAIGCGVGNSYATSWNGAEQAEELWSCGVGEYTGISNTGTTGFIEVFTKIWQNWYGFTKLRAGTNFLRCISSDDSLPEISTYFSGLDGYGESGSYQSEPTIIEGQLLSWGGAGLDMLDVASGQSHTIIIREDRTLWASGLNTTGQCGLGPDIDMVNNMAQTGIIYI